jgi:hypothetical protein
MRDKVLNIKELATNKHRYKLKAKYFENPQYAYSHRMPAITVRELKQHIY